MFPGFRIDAAAPERNSARGRFVKTFSVSLPPALDAQRTPQAAALAPRQREQAPFEQPPSPLLPPAPPAFSPLPSCAVGLARNQRAGPQQRRGG